MFEVGDFIFMGEWYAYSPKEGDMICLIQPSHKERYLFDIYGFAAVNNTSSKRIINSTWSFETENSLKNSCIVVRSMHVTDLLKFDLFNEKHWPSFKIFFRKLIEKELSSESPKISI